MSACVADIVFVIDNSGSIRDNDPPGGNNWLLILNFIKSVIQMLDVGPAVARIGAVDFGEVKLVILLSSIEYPVIFHDTETSLFASRVSY